DLAARAFDVTRVDVSERALAYGNHAQLRVRVRDLEELVDEVRLLGALGAVVKVDTRPGKVDGSRHSEKRRDADAAGDPDLAGVVGPLVPEPAERPLHARVAPGLELLELGRVVAQCLHQNPAVAIGRRGP